MRGAHIPQHADQILAIGATGARLRDGHRAARHAGAGQQPQDAPRVAQLDRQRKDQTHGIWLLCDRQPAAQAGADAAGVAVGKDDGGKVTAARLSADVWRVWPLGKGFGHRTLTNKVKEKQTALKTSGY